MIAISTTIGSKGGVTASGVPLLQSTMLSLNPTALWPLTETEGDTAYDISGNGLNGTYQSAITKNNIISPDGINNCPLFPNSGLNGAVDVTSAGLISAFNPSSFSVIAWVKSLNWADTIIRYVWALRANTTNYAWFRKLNVANYARPEHIAGGVSNKHNWTTTKTTDWYMLTYTLSESADQFKIYVNNSLFGTQVALGTWSGALLTGAIGNFDGASSNPWGGWISYVGMWFGTILSLADIQTIYNSATLPL